MAGCRRASFSLDDDSDGTLSNTQTFTNVPAGSGYSVSETVPSGWSQAAAICSDGSLVSNIGVSPGEIGHVHVHKQPAAATSWPSRTRSPTTRRTSPSRPAAGSHPPASSLDDDADGTLSNTRTYNDVTPGAGYSLAETVPSGWDQASATCDDGSPVSNIDVAAGETVTCTFTNHKRGQIVVVKNSVPNDAQDFAFTAGGGLSPTSFSLDDDSDGTLSNTRTFANVVPGSGYSVSETVPAGWDQFAATCDDGSSLANITVSVGETVTCTFTNRKRGRIVAVKDALPDDPQDFSFTAGGGLSPASFSLDDDADGTLSNTRTFNDLVSGSGYSLSETVPSGWDQTAATCDDGSPVSNIAVAPGETVTCTFQNRKRGRIVVMHDAVPNDPQDFAFTAGGGLSPSSFSSTTTLTWRSRTRRTFNDVPVGSGYSIAETRSRRLGSRKRHL